MKQVNINKVVLSLILISLIGIIFTDKVYAEDDSFTSSYTCTYKGQSSNSTITIKKESSSGYDQFGQQIQTSVQYVVTYPDGTSKTFGQLLTNGNVFPTNKCEDIFYYPGVDSRKIFMVDKDSYYYVQTMNQYCASYADLEQYCENGQCKIENASCGNAYLETEWGTCPAEILPIVKFLKIAVINTIKIFVPIILILMGTIDLTKAVMASDEKAMKDASNKFIKRIITAVLIFFITTIVTIVMNMLASSDIEGFEDWKACWFFDEKEVDINE